MWPLSRADAPKFLLDLTGSGSSLLRATYDRLAGLSAGPVMVVTGRSHAGAVQEQLPELTGDDTFHRELLRMLRARVAA